MSLPSVQRRELPARLGEAVTQLRRLEHLELRAETQELAIRRAEMLERNDCPTVLVDARIARQPPYDLRIDPHRHRDARTRLLERARPLVPERGELEVARTLERLLERAHRCDARHAVDAHPDRAQCDEVPRPALEDEPERI